jgi:hypothetical protein
MALLKINTTEYPVMLASLPDGALGEADPMTQLITITPNLVPHRFVETLLHEALHAFLCETGQQGRQFSEEEMCTVAGCAMASLFVANPLLLPALHHMLRVAPERVGPGIFERALARAREED